MMVAGLHDGPEVLTRQVRGEGLAELVAVGVSVFGLHCRSERNELGRIAAPLVVVDVQPNADDAVRPELVGLLLHARHGQLSGVVHRLGELWEFLALAPPSTLDPGVIDGRTHNEAERMKAGLLHQEELVHREVRGEKAMGELFEPVIGVLG
jgi:hypothetical protein